jgi:hypothetical protein
MSPRHHNPSDPAATRIPEHSSQAGSALTGQGGPERPAQREAEDVLNRSAGERYDTPRRYDEDDSSEEEDRN